MKMRTKAFILLIAIVLLFVYGCGKSTSEQIVQSKFNNDSQKYYCVQGKTAVLTTDVVLKEVYSIEYSINEDETVTVNHISNNLGDVTLKSGQIVLALCENDGTTDVMVPGFSIPFIWGTVDSTIISKDPRQIAQGNMGIIIEGAEYYDKQEGNVIGRMDTDTRVEIVERSNEWCSFRDVIAGRDSGGWIRTNQINYDFDLIVPVLDRFP